MTADVSVVTENLPKSQVGLTIEVPAEQVDRAYERALARAAQRIRVGGFRPGRAPRHLVEARLGPGALRDEVLGALIPPVVEQALRERDIEPIDQAQLEVQELERGRPARVTARVSVLPEVTLPDLDSLRVERQHTELTDEMVEDRLDELREKLAEIEPVEREVRVGDVVVTDVRMLVDGSEVASEARTAVEAEVRDGRMIPELVAALPGLDLNQVATVEVTLPEDHRDPELRGKPARVEVTVRGVKEKRVPELTDEVAAQLSSGEHATAEALQAAVREDLTLQLARIDELGFEQAAVKAVVDATAIELPDALVQREVARTLLRQERTLQQRGLRLDRYLQYVGKTAAEHTSELVPEAEARLRLELVMDQLGRRHPAPTDDETRAYMREEAGRQPEMAAELDAMLADEEVVDSFRHRLARVRTLEALVARLGGQPAADTQVITAQNAERNDGPPDLQ
jgi:trigger factor